MGAYEDEEMSDGNSKYNEPDYENYESYNYVQHVMEFVHGCFCVVERQCKCFAFFECINLEQKQGRKVVDSGIELSKNIKQSHFPQESKRAPQFFLGRK